jgi:hypothetical protein
VIIKEEDGLRPKIAAFTAVLVLISTITLAANHRTDEESPRYLIRSGQAEFVPAEGSRARLEAGRRHLLVQFYNIPDSAERASWAEQGLRLLRYVGGNAYAASLKDAGAASPGRQAGIRAMVDFRPEMKLSPLFEEDRYLRERLSGGKREIIYLRFHEDVDFEEALETIRAAGAGTDNKAFQYAHVLVATADHESILILADSDAVDFIDPPLPPAITLNEDARRLVGAESIYNKRDYRKPTGKSVKVGIWDGGPIASHGDFGGRVTNMETGEEMSDHATHVSGTIGGSGNGNPEATGMAGKASLFGYDFNGNPIAEMQAAIAYPGVMISNNSWGYTAGWYEKDVDDTEDSYFVWLGLGGFGYYHTGDAYMIDLLVRQNNFPVVWAASNDRNDAYLGPHRHQVDGTQEYHDLHPSDPDYGSVPWSANAKNSIVAGAVMKDTVMTPFSCWGPTDDGRLKPDVTAPGYRLTSTVFNNGYDAYSGTSMATPVVTGVAALLIDYANRTGFADTPADPAKTVNPVDSDLLKALLVHSARDIGPAGPDYSFGHGLVDAELAAKVLKAAAGDESEMTAAIINSSIDQGKKKKEFFSVPVGAKELRATLVWNDPPGSQLVNDLDLWVSGGGGKHRPFVLNPAQPAALAVQGRNYRDNVEHIVIKNPKAGRYKIFVKGNGVPQGPQDYVLVVSAGGGNGDLDLLTEGTFRVDKLITSGSSDWDNVPEKAAFNKGDEFWAYAYLYVDANAKYDGGEYYGSVTAGWQIRDSGGAVILKQNYGSDGFYPRSNVWRWRLGKYVIPNDMPSGTYRVQVTITMHNGETGSASYTFRVN